jgi:hypothetical protein
MNTETKTETETNLVAWNGETYKGAGDWFDKFKNDPEFIEYTEDLNADEILRLALFAYNGAWGLVPEDMPLFISQELNKKQQREKWQFRILRLQKCLMVYT